MKRMNILLKLGQRIRGLRRTHNISQEQLAEKADLHPTFIGKIERAEIKPTIVSLEKIAQAFQIPISELLSFPDDQKIYDRNVEKLKDSLNKAAEELKIAKNLVHESRSIKKKN